MSIHFHNVDNNVRLANKKHLKAYLEDLFIHEGRALASLDIILCSDTYLLEINRKYLEHDDFTDVISFSLGAAGEPIQGEIYVSTDRIKENSKIFNTTYLTELHRVIFHGTLHLCGYTDKSSGEKTRMTQREDFYLSQFPFQI